MHYIDIDDRRTGGHEGQPILSHISEPRRVQVGRVN